MMTSINSSYGTTSPSSTTTTATRNIMSASSSATPSPSAAAASDLTNSSMERLAPLASMEDLSVLNTPMITPLSTPGQSPKTRSKLGHNSVLEPLLESSLEPITVMPPMLDLTPRRHNWTALPTTSTPFRRSSRPMEIDASPVSKSNSSGTATIDIKHENDNKEEEKPLMNSNDRIQTLPRQVHFVSPLTSEETRASMRRRNKWERLRSGHRAEFLDQEPPNDRCNLVFVILMLHGLAAALPWHVFLVSDATHDSEQTSESLNLLVKYALERNTTRLWLSSSPSRHFDWSRLLSFLLHFSLSNKLLPILTLCPLIFVQLVAICCRPLSKGFVVSVLIEVVVIVLAIVWCMLDENTWGIGGQAQFSIVIFILTIFVGVSGTHLMAVFGISGRLPGQFNIAPLIGSNACGVLVTSVYLICLVLRPYLQTASIYFLICALFIMLAAFDTFFALPLNRFYRYHNNLFNTSRSETALAKSMNNNSNSNSCCSNFFVGLNAFLCGLITFSVFPGLLRKVESQDNSNWSDLFFFPVTGFLAFFLVALLGNVLAVLLPWRWPIGLILLSLLRIVHLPAIMLSNLTVDTSRVWPVLFDQDWAYVVIVVSLAFSHGYVSASSLALATRVSSSPSRASFSSTVTYVLLTFGCWFGLIVSNFLPLVLKWNEIEFDEPLWWPKNVF